MKRLHIAAADMFEFISYGLSEPEMTACLNGPAFKVIDDDGNDVFLCGMIFPWPGLGEVWLKPAKNFASYISAPRTAKQLIDNVINFHKPRRVQAQVDKTNEINMRFVKWLGFHEEAELRDYGPNGETYAVMRYIWQ